MRRIRPLALLIALVTPLAAAAQSPGTAPPSRVGEMVFVRNQVRGTPPAGTAGPLAVGDGLVLRHLVETAEGSGARLTLGQGGNLSLGAKTRVTLDQVVLSRAQAGRSKLSLAVGTLRLKLDALFQGGLDIETSSAVVGIKGTDVMVEATEALTVVTVFEGVVTVVGKVAGAGVEVAAGQRTVVPKGRVPSRPAKPKQMPEGDPAEAPALDAPALDAPGAPQPPPVPSTPGGPKPPQQPSRPPEPPRPSAPPGAPPTQEPGRPQEPQGSGPPRITACAARGQNGEPICVCGRFPEPRSIKGLTLDGRPAEVVSVSPTRLLVKLPESLAAGDHVLAGDPRAGFSAADRCKVGVLEVTAEYREHLKKGRSTYLTLTVRGSDERLRIRIQNMSPTIVRVKGGADQVVTTRGGRNNSVRVRVKAIGDGRAHIRHQVQGFPPCPCGS